MTKGITQKEPDPELVYADIFHHPRHSSSRHAPMSLSDRAAQFAPFAALSGYDDIVAEEARYVEEEHVLEESALEQLNRKLNLIASALASGQKPTLSITYFEPDPKKAGGSYVTVMEEIQKVDADRRQLVLSRTQGRAGSKATICFDRILEIAEK